MNLVQRSEIADYQTYNEKRDAIRAQVMAEKEPRRIHVGDHLTFLFETTNTVRYQIQEMMRIERIVREADIVHEIETYNALLGGKGELGCTLLIEIDDEKERNRLLRAWLDLPKYLYVATADGERARATWDAAQVGEDRLSSVQYLKFRLGSDAAPIALGVDHPELTLETALTSEQRFALLADLRA
jgi:hypothetical protein